MNKIKCFDCKLFFWKISISAGIIHKNALAVAKVTWISWINTRYVSVDGDLYAWCSTPKFRWFVWEVRFFRHITILFAAKLTIFLDSSISLGPRLRWRTIYTTTQPLKSITDEFSHPSPVGERKLKNGCSDLPSQLRYLALVTGKVRHWGERCARLRQSPFELPTTREIAFFG